jgi:hypothetical protein
MKFVTSTVLLLSLTGSVASGESKDNAAFNDLYAKAQLNTDCLRGTAKCFPPSDTEIQARIEYFSQWQTLIVTHIEKFKEGPQKLRNQAEAYDEEARRSTGDAAKAYQRIAEVLRSRAKDVGEAIEGDLQKVKNSNFSATLSELKSKGSSLSQERLKSLLRTSKQQVDDAYEIVVSGYGRKVMTSLNWNTGVSESHIELLDPDQSAFGILSGGPAARSYFTALRVPSPIQSKNSKCYIRDLPGEDIGFVRWIIGDGTTRKSLELNCEATTKIQRIRSALPTSWYFAKQICPEYDRAGHKLTIYYTEHSETSYTLYPSCGGGGPFMNGDQAIENRLMDNYYHETHDAQTGSGSAR